MNMMSPPPPLAAVIAIPVKDEEERIGPCLRALARAARKACGAVQVHDVVLLLNNCRDATADVIRQLSPRLPFPVSVIEVQLPSEHAHAGRARRLAADHAAKSLETCAGNGVILITDADSRVSPDWLLAQALCFAEGADAVAGAISIDRRDLARWPATLRRRELNEALYGRLLSRLAHLLDPQEADPWPRHDQASGASIGVTLHAYHLSGGIPEIRVGEDRAFVAALKCLGLRVRHDARVRVTTSGRLQGRAEGGAADTICSRASCDGAPCDERLEPVAQHKLRLHRRAGLRRNYHPRQFHHVWSQLESCHPMLRRTPVAPQTLPNEIAKARRELRLLSTLSPDIEPIAFAPFCAHLVGERTQTVSKQPDGVIAAQGIVRLAGVVDHYDIAPNGKAGSDTLPAKREVGRREIVEHL